MVERKKGDEECWESRELWLRGAAVGRPIQPHAIWQAMEEEGTNKRSTLTTGSRLSPATDDRLQHLQL